MITKYVQLWFVVPKHQVEMAWDAIARAVQGRGLSFFNVPGGVPTKNLPLGLEWSDIAEPARPPFARTAEEWERYCGNRRDIKIVTFALSSQGRGIDEVLQEWQALGAQGVFVGGSWASGFDAPDPLSSWNYAGKVGHAPAWTGW